MFVFPYHVRLVNGFVRMLCKSTRPAVPCYIPFQILMAFYPKFQRARMNCWLIKMKQINAAIRPCFKGDNNMVGGHEVVQKGRTFALLFRAREPSSLFVAWFLLLLPLQCVQVAVVRKIDHLWPVDTKTGISFDSFNIYSVQGPIASVCTWAASFKTTLNKCIFWDCRTVTYV